MIGFGNASQGVPCCNAEAGIAGIKLAEELLNAFPGGRTGSRAKHEINHILHALFRKNTIYMESFQKFPHRHVHGTSFINRKFFFRFCFQNNGSKAGRWAYGKGKLCQQLVNVFFCVSVRLGKQKGGRHFPWNGWIRCVWSAFFPGKDPWPRSQHPGFPEDPEASQYS